MLVNNILTQGKQLIISKTIENIVYNYLSFFKIFETIFEFHVSKQNIFLEFFNKKNKIL